MRDPLYIILGNSKRLLDDAELLAKSERFASAVSLAVLAVEEAGKVFWLYWDIYYGRLVEDKTPRRSVWSHQAKQLGAGVPVGVFGMNNAIKELLRERGLPDDDDAVAKVYSLISNSRAEKNEAVDENSRSDAGKAIIEYLAWQLRDSNELNFLNSVENGDIQKLKNRGFYVDVANNGEIISSPNDISQDEAETWLKWAKQVVNAFEFLNNTD